MAKATTATNSKGELVVNVGDTKYLFRHPRGRDLVVIERGINDTTRTEAENLALVMASLSDISEDDYLDLPLGTFKQVGEKVMEYFRASSEG